MSQQDEADTQPGEQPADLPAESFQPDNTAQPVEMQSPEGELPPPDDVAQPGQVESAVDEQPQPEHVAQPFQAESALDEEPQPGKAELQPESVPEPRRLSRADQEAYDRQRRRFAACGRCGYFVADCLVFVGEEAFHAALLDSRDGWVRLEGDETFRRLLSNAYGVQLDIAYDYFDGSCPECRRRFVFAEQEEGPTRLKIQA